MDVPPLLRRGQFRSAVAGLCGGPMEEEVKEGENRWLKDVRFGAKGNADGFIPVVCNVNF